MDLSAEQVRAVQSGQVVPVDVAGSQCVVLRKDVYDRETLDYDPWTTQEIDLLAAETVDVMAGDGLDEPDNT
jgi:hypothetical protein